MQFYNRSGYIIINDKTDARKYTGRLSFEIDKFQGHDAGKGTLKLWNLNQDSKNWIENVNLKSTKISSAFAGYGGDNKLLFSGEYFLATTKRDGADVVTTILVKPGQTFLKSSFINPNGITNDYQLYNLCIAQAQGYGLNAAALTQGVMQKMIDHAYKKPLCGSGTTQSFLTRIANNSDLHWSPDDNGTISFYDPQEASNSEVILLSESTGMIGEVSKADVATWKVTSFLNPELVPGQQVAIDSVHFPNRVQLKIIHVKHTGDTWEGDDFKSEVEVWDKNLGPNPAPF